MNRDMQSIKARGARVAIARRQALEPAPRDLNVTAPVVVDLGKARRSRIKDLKRGRGRLMEEVDEVVDDVRAEMGAAAEGKHFIPIVIVYRRKRRKGRGMFGF
jgi:hypothetical protein